MITKTGASIVPYLIGGAVGAGILGIPAYLTGRDYSRYLDDTASLGTMYAALADNIAKAPNASEHKDLITDLSSAAKTQRTLWDQLSNKTSWKDKSTAIPLLRKAHDLRNDMEKETIARLGYAPVIASSDSEYRKAGLRSAALPTLAGAGLGTALTAIHMLK